MGWSPPKKITVIISFLLLVGGLVLAVIAMGIWNVPDFPLDPLITGIIALVLVFFSWILFLIGVISRGI
ncbi:MAG: hypothetical protein ACTSQ8_14510 [Candidatus Helarchaeota archaeon]